MKRTYLWVALSATTLFVVGCGGGETAEQSAAPTESKAAKPAEEKTAFAEPVETRAEQSSDSPAQIANDVPAPSSAGSIPQRDPSAPPKRSEAEILASVDTSKPDVAVSSFLKALRNGDDQVAETLLTLKAREETAKHNLAVQPPGTPNASYQVSGVEFANAEKTAAYVNSQWSETFQDGTSESYEIIWVVRSEAKGWRVAGMATKIAESQPPLFLNFENPVEMMQKWQEATELARQQTAQDGEVRQAQLPSGENPK